MTATISIMLLFMVTLVFLNVPIAISLAVVAVAAIWITQGAYMLPNVALVMFEGATNFPLLAIPLFILAGGIMNFFVDLAAADRPRDRPPRLHPRRSSRW